MAMGEAEDMETAYEDFQKLQDQIDAKTPDLKDVHSVPANR